MYQNKRGDSRHSNDKNGFVISVDHSTFCRNNFCKILTFVRITDFQCQGWAYKHVFELIPTEVAFGNMCLIIAVLRFDSMINYGNLNINLSNHMFYTL